MTSAAQGLAPLGLLLAGPTADTFGVEFWFVLTGITVMGTGPLFFPTIVRLEDHACPPAGPERPKSHLDKGSSARPPSPSGASH
ncbi:MAG: hypothetical protein JW953_11405 [Anaerolineae bacterium]|nr:hypothetical protein [Anaerolineae bacterium]